MSDMARVVFPADHNSALALLPSINQACGALACMVMPKRERPAIFSRAQAEQLARDGAIIVDEQAGSNPILLIANGSYQLTEMQRATRRLTKAGVSYRLVYLQGPGRFRVPRDRWEIEALAGDGVTERLFPEQIEMRVLLSYMRPEVARGHLWLILPDMRRNSVLGYRNRGGTLDDGGMQFANRASWANVLDVYARLLDVPRTALLNPMRLLR
jgi:phosphoketolase